MAFGRALDCLPIDRLIIQQLQVSVRDRFDVCQTALSLAFMRSIKRNNTYHSGATASIIA